MGEAKEMRGLEIWRLIRPLGAMTASIASSENM
jgi:hypothetical protein